MFSKKFTIFPLVIILVAFVSVAIFRLEEIPGEWFGDISIVNNYVLSILGGNFPLGFVTSAGPLYFYLISPFIAFFGVSYLNYKLISVGVGAAGLIAFYFFAKEIASRRVALLTTFITAFSFWYMVWARLGNYNIITPGVTALMMYFFIKYTKSHNTKWLFFSIFTSCLGLFIYAGTFLLPFVLFVLLMFEMVVSRKVFEVKRFLLILLLYVPALVIFALIVAYSRDNFVNGYLGIKIFNNEALSLNDFWYRLFANALRTATMLNIEGDIVFRWNIPKMPLLDKISSIFFLIGFVGALLKEKKYLPFILLPLFIFPIPSMLPGHPAVEVPSSPRTMAIMPFVFLLTARGIEYLRLLTQKSQGAVLGMSVTAIFLVLITCLNLYNYFVIYPVGLPNKNTPFGKIIASYIDTLPTNTEIYLASLRRGEWGQPEYDGIYWALKNKEKLIIDDLPNCYKKPTRFFSVIFASYQDEQVNSIRSCFPKATLEQHIINGQKVFWSITNLQAPQPLQKRSGQELYSPSPQAKPTRPRILRKYH